MNRGRLPDRRLAEAVAFEHAGRKWTAAFGRFADGRVAELFLDAPKESPLADSAREAAIVLSLALQFGCPIDVIQHALDGRDAGPIGAALALIEPLDVSRVADPAA